MSVKVANNRFINSSFAGFYQQILNNVVTLQELGKWLIGEAETAQVFREAEKLEEVSTILCNFPIREVRTIGNYYKGLGAYRRGEDARSIFEEVAEYSRTYKAKALMSLAAVEARDGRYERELGYFVQAMKYIDNPSAIVEVYRCIAVVKAKEDYHRAALSDLEKIFPLIKFASSDFYYQYLNSYAVELGEVGRIEEAQNVCRITLASPFLFAYPEWRETWQELTLRGYKSRSVVSVLKPALDKDNVVPLPVVERSSDPPQKGQARIFDLQKWAKKMGKKPNGNGKKLPENMTSRDMVIKLMNLTTQEGISDEKLQKIIDYVEKLLSEPD